MQSIDNIFPQLTTAKRVVITMHQKPDGDAMGSTLGLYHFLKNLGHDACVVSPTNWASFLDWMPGVDTVIDFESKTEKATALINEAEWIFCLDFNTLNRTKKMEPLLDAAKAERILIDHHQQPQTEKFAYGVSDVSKSSTCEMVYDMIMASGYADHLNNDAAQCLYAGVMTDTGSFRFPATTANVHRMVAALKEKGLNHTPIHEALYDNFSETRLRFIGNVLLNRLEVFFEYNTALIVIPQSDLLKYDIRTGDTEGLVNYPLSIEGIKLAAIVIDRGEERKWSFRSKGKFDVNSFARKYFGGGGHFNAAGGASFETLERTVADFKAAMKENREQIKYIYILKIKTTMKKISYLVIGCALAFAACDSKDSGFKKGMEGIEYKIINDGKGDLIKKGDFVEFHAVTTLRHKDGKDSILSATREMGGPQIFQYDSTSLPPAYVKIFGELKKGDSLVTKVLTDSIFKAQPEAMPPFMKKGDYLYTSLRILNVYKTQAEADAAKAAAAVLTEAAAKAKAAKTLKDDQDKLLAYFEKNKIHTVKTPQGAFIEVITPGSGPVMDTTNFAKINYTGTILEGKMFDSNTDPSKGHVEPLLVNLTNDKSLGNGVIDGFSDALRMMNKGEKAKIYIPSPIGYGPNGMGPELPGNSILVFDTEVLDVLTVAQAKAEQAAALDKMKAMQKKYSDSIAKLPKQAAVPTPTAER